MEELKIIKNIIKELEKNNIPTTKVEIYQHLIDMEGMHAIDFKDLTEAEQTTLIHLIWDDWTRYEYTEHTLFDYCYGVMEHIKELKEHDFNYKYFNDITMDFIV